MKIKNKSLLLNFSGYTLINLFNSLTPFIVLPILTHNLRAYDIGIIDLFNTTIIFLTPIIGLAFIQSISKLYFVFEDKRKYISVLATSIFLIGGTILLITLLLLYATNVFDLDNEKRFLVLLVVIQVFLNLIVEGFLLLKRNEENLKQFAFIRLFKSFLDILLTIIIIFLITNYKARIYSILASSFITAILVVIMMYRNAHIRFHFDKQMAKRIFIYSSPLIFHTLFANVLNYADRYFINEFHSTSLLGQYSVAYQLCMVMSLLINSFNMAWAPYYMKNMMGNGEKFINTVSSTYKYYVLVLGLFGALLFLVMPMVYEYYVGSNYKVDGPVYASLLMAYFFNGLYRFKVNRLFFYEKTLLIARLSMITAIVNLTLNYICIKAWGILGAAISTLFSYLVLYLLLEKELYSLKRKENGPKIS